MLAGVTKELAECLSIYGERRTIVMKKMLVFLLVMVFLFSSAALGEETGDWQTAPVITQAYEISSGNLYLEWVGYAPVYQVYMDGENITSVIVNHAIIPVKTGTHSILVYPISESKNADTRIELGLNAQIIGGSIGLDLAALGLDPKKLMAGNPSMPLNIDYTADPVFNAVPEQLSAVTDSQDRVRLSFTDRYHADEYLVSVKIGNDVNYVRFTRGTEEADALMQQDKTMVTLTLDPSFLEKQECMAPELDSKYTFTVQLHKYAENMLNDERVLTAAHQSRESGGYSYIPTAAWKTAPMISYASQTADGQITLQWEHEDYDLGCEYSIVKVEKALGIKTGEIELGTTRENTFIINDLMNGVYALSVVPILENEKGAASAEASVSVVNDWVAAPVLTCEESSGNHVRLTWLSAEGVESYHLTVYRGNSESLLRFIDLDYSQYAEYDLAAVAGEMEYLFAYDDAINPETGVKLKFEIYGIRHTGRGEEQRTAASAKTMTIGQEKTSEE